MNDTHIDNINQYIQNTFNPNSDKPYIYFPPMMLEEDAKYIFHVEFENFAGISNRKDFEFRLGVAEGVKVKILKIGDKFTYKDNIFFG